MNEPQAWQERFQAELKLGTAARRRLLAIAVMLVAAAAVGSYAVVKFPARQEADDLAQWTARLQIAADARADAIADWVKSGRASVDGIASNPTVRLFLSGIDADIGAGTRIAQLEFVRAYLNGLEEREIAADPAVPGPAFALLQEDTVLIGSSGFPERLALAQPGGTAAMYVSDDPGTGQPMLVYSVPIFSIQADPGGMAPVAWALRAELLEPSLQARLARPTETTATGRTILFLTLDNSSGAREQHAVSSKSDTTADRLGLGELAAIRDPGVLSRGAGAAGPPILAFASRVIGLPGWTVVRSIDESEALGPVRLRRQVWSVALALSILTGTVLILLFWRHWAGAQAQRAAASFASLYRFVEAVAANQPAGLLAMDKAGQIRFANLRARKLLKSPDSDPAHLPQLSGIRPALGRKISGLIKKALDNGAAADEALIDENGRREIFALSAIRLDEAVPEDLRILAVIEEITEIVEAREKHAEELRSVVSLLMAALEARDPYSVHHSARVAELAGRLAEEMGLPEDEVNALTTAAQLMNVGKLFVPRATLVGRDELDDEAREQLRQRMREAVGMLKRLNFTGAVIETLEQLHEHYDGSGEPDGRKGEDILRTARILQPVNALVAMASPRSFRPALKHTEALQQIIEGAGRLYDPRVVTALRDLLEGAKGAEIWDKAFSQPDIELAPVD